MKYKVIEIRVVNPNIIGTIVSLDNGQEYTKEEAYRRSDYYRSMGINAAIHPSGNPND